MIAEGVSSNHLINIKQSYFFSFNFIIVIIQALLFIIIEINAAKPSPIPLLLSYKHFVALKINGVISTIGQQFGYL